MWPTNTSNHQVHFQCSFFVRSRVLEMDNHVSAAPYIKYLALSSLSQLDHYPPVSYTLPDASDTQFNLVKSLFLGKVFGKCLLLPLSRCANFYPSSSDHNSACSPCPCPDLISSPHALLCFRQIGNECFGVNWLQYLISLLFILIVDK